MEALWLLVGMALGSSFTLAIAGRFPQRSTPTDVTAPPPDTTSTALDHRFDQIDQHLQNLQLWHESHHAQLAALGDISQGRFSGELTENLTSSSSGNLPRNLEDSGERSPDPEPQEADPLASAVGLDYGPLNQCLGWGQWRDADQMTRELLAASVGMPMNTTLGLEDWQRVPATDLRTMDNLWRYWSGDRFGFTPQAMVWQASEANYEQFCDAVKWRTNEEWIYRDDLEGDRNAPVGHWPAIVWGTRSCYGQGAGLASQGMTGLMDRAIAVLIA